MLAVSRALGDIILQPYVTPEPEITEFDISPTDRIQSNQLLILACDGVWDVITDEEATTLIRSSPDPGISTFNILPFHPLNNIS